MIVVDASALTTALAYPDVRGQAARRALVRDPAWTAPEHWKAEVFSALRALTLGAAIEPAHASAAIERIPQLGVLSVSLDGLLRRMWELRDNLSGYDAAYVALAQAHCLTLITGDRRLARAATEHCRVELIKRQG